MIEFSQRISLFWEHGYDVEEDAAHGAANGRQKFAFGIYLLGSGFRAVSYLRWRL